MAEQLKTFGELFSETWTVYKRRWPTLLGVMLLGSFLTIGIMMVVGFVAALAMGGFQTVTQKVQAGQADAMVTTVVAILFPFIFVLAMWSQSAVIAASVNDELGVLESLREGWRRLWSMAWILGLAAGVIMTGFLLLVPGVIFAVSLMFCLYPLYEDDVRGMTALMLSRRYVRGRWWNTLGKLLLIWLMAVVLQVIPFVGSFLYLAFMPFLMLFLVAMYRNLRDSCTAEPVGGRGWMWLMAWLGMILPLLGLIGAVVTMKTQMPHLLDQQVNMLEQLEEDESDDDRAEKPGPAPSVSPLQTRNQESGSEPGETANLWRDPVGDTARFGVAHWLDLRQVRVEAQNSSLKITMTLATPIQAAFNAASTTAQPLHRVAVLYFDTDVDRNTGGPAGGDSARQGYDFGLDLTLEVQRNKPRSGTVHAALFQVDNGSRRFLGSLADDGVTVQGNTLVLRIPYSRLGLAPGRRIRMSYQESQQENGSGLAKDKLIELK